MQLKDFPLSWRWMNESYALLPDAVLARIHPLDEEQAAMLFNESLEHCVADGLDESKFSLSRIDTSGVLSLKISQWLFDRHNDRETEAFVSWQPDTAVKTTWGIFATYWNEFCYPASDDLCVWPESGAWVLLYHHEEQLQFGMRALIDRESAVR